jgi:hypothetical protein
MWTLIKHKVYTMGCNIKKINIFKWVLVPNGWDTLHRKIYYKHVMGLVSSFPTYAMWIPLP